MLLEPKRLTAGRLRASVRTALATQESAQPVARQLDPAGTAGRVADAAEALLDGDVIRTGPAMAPNV